MLQLRSYRELSRRCIHVTSICPVIILVHVESLPIFVRFSYKFSMMKWDDNQGSPDWGMLQDIVLVPGRVGHGLKWTGRHKYSVLFVQHWVL